MKNVRLSRTTFQLIERAVEALERIGRELERYNDRYERTAEGRRRRTRSQMDRD